MNPDEKTPGELAVETANHVWETTLWLIDSQDTEDGKLAFIQWLMDEVKATRNRENPEWDETEEYLYSSLLFHFGFQAAGFVSIDSPKGQAILAEINGA